MIKVQAGLLERRRINLVKLGTTQLPPGKEYQHIRLFGADKKGEDNIMRGIALRFGTDDIDVKLVL